MIGSFRNFAKTKFAGILVFIIIIPFVFWGMGSMFSGGNTNSLAKIGNKNISTKEFIDHINNSGIPEKTVRENLNNNIIEELLATLISKTLLDMEIQDFKIIYSENSLLKRIKKNKNFLDENKNFNRIKYEKFLLENNLTASSFENSLKKQELKKNLFKYVSGGIKSPYFLKNKIFINENKKIDIEFLDLDLVHDKNVTNSEIDDFIKNNQDILKVDFIDFSYAKITPQSLIEIDEFNDEFFKKIDEIENSILNGSSIKEINEVYNLKPNEIKNFILNDNSDETLQEIYSKRNEDKIQLIDKNDYYLIFEISNLNKKIPNFNDPYFLESLKKSIVLKKKFEFNKNIFEKIDEKKFNDDEFIKISKDKKNIKSVTLESLNDNQIFDSESVNLIYTLPNKSFTLVTGEKDKVYLSRINSIYYSDIDKNADNIKEYSTKSNNDIINDIYTSYDLSLNSKYKVKIFNQTIDRVKNYFR